MATRTIVEGRTDLHVPTTTDTSRAGPGARTEAPFYNPAMAGSRDTSVLLATWLRSRRSEPRMLDGLASGGARGLRVAVEAGLADVTLNDRDDGAVAAARTNVAANDAADRVRVEHGDLNVLLRRGRWDYVEIDPFGSPIPFIDAAAGAVRRNGLLAVTATDTAPLHGARRAAGRRRYMAEPPPRNAPGWHEAALRLLMGTIVRMIAQHDVAATPVLGHVWDHTLRAVFRIEPGAQRADAALDDVAPATLCAECQQWGLRDAPCPCGRGWATGPYWLGPIQDGDVCADLVERCGQAVLAEPDRVSRLLAACRDEADMPPFYVHLHRGAKVRGVGQLPRTDTVLEALRDAGHRAAVSANDELGVKTDASAGDVLDLLVHN